ncbi:hypothetical protein R4P64_03380 [Rhodococcus sp. IEGM 1366]|uniref:hypothetical protein n=1 Tax=Rhodococcus sp. IEGM 1366 TaxID=3082223 RepID=UPI0029547D0F|nr:hypothetical protein [Rhodococcus sp. IEGM 1366]MDV8065540.1 hypothetical protein [Rhodococcus sp. IEGM 1366]
MTADLRTIPGVELVKTGTWEISTGTWHVTAELLAAAKASHESGTIPRPIVKLGHVDERFDGEPALGYIDNLQIRDDGNTLVGDLVGVPAWLATIAASAYPNRSVEAVHDLEFDGTAHPLVLTAVALLGVTKPGISTLTSLADVRELYDVAASAGTPVTITLPGKGVQISHTLTPRQRVMVRAAAARRRHRAAQQIIAAITAPEQEQ